MSHKTIEIGLSWLGINKSIQNYASEISSKDRYGQVSFVYWILVNRGFSEITVVCFSLTASVSYFKFFSWQSLVSFLLVFKIKLHPRNGNQILAEISLLLGFRPKKVYNRTSVMFLESFCHFSFLKKVWKENYCYSWLPISNFMSVKILGIYLLPKMLSSDQIVKDYWTYNTSRISRGLRIIFCKWVTNQVDLV